MRKILVAVALYVVIAFPFSGPVNFSSAAQAMPAPVANNDELSAGLAQWGAETFVEDDLNETELQNTLLTLARPYSPQSSKTDICETLAAAAREHELPVGFFVRLINQESGFNPEVVSHAGAQGVAQFMPEVAKEWGLKNPFDPHAALVASARFLRSLYNQFGNWGLAAAAYNGGMGRVQKWVSKKGKLPDETRHYVKTITGAPAESWVGGPKAQQAKFTIPPRAPCQEIAHLADPPGSDTREIAKVEVASVTPAGKGATNVTVVRTRKGSKVAVAVIKVKQTSKVAAVAGKIAAPKSIIADAGFTAALPKGKRGKAADVKVAEKSPAKEKAAAKAPVKAKDGKKAPAKGRVQVADARGAHK